MTAEIPVFEGNDDPTEILHKVVFLDENFNLAELQDQDDGLFDARTLLTTIIHLGEKYSLLKRRFSQTPLDPSILYESSLPYLTAVTNELSSRLYNKAADVGLPDIYTDAILREVSLELIKRTTSNDGAARRLLDLLKGQKIGVEEARMIWRAKTGEATMAETGRLLLRYPQMESMEALKYTEPLDWEKITEADRRMQRGLGEFHRLTDEYEASDLFMKYYQLDDEKNRNPRLLVPKNIPENEYHAALQAAVMGWKENIAEVSMNGSTIQLVQKTTTLRINPAVELTIEPHLRSFGNGLTNLQPISKSWYWRVKPQAESDPK